MGWFKRTPGWARLIGAINLVGIVYGFYYYWRYQQFQQTPVALWIFVPDSPLAVLWAELALVAYWLKRRPGWLDALAFVGNVQVGLWTCYVLVAYAPYMGTFDFSHGVPLNLVLLGGHFGMAVLGLVFLQGLRDEGRLGRGRVLAALAIAATYYLVNDALDYFGPSFYPGTAPCGMRPITVPCIPGGPETGLTLVTFGLTLAGLAALAWVAWPRPRP
ncbi:MAG: hypothetical protein QOE90_3557 [Thermoplasmata archaeon]|nr:hypothetical protein [Thermoplasmata archaeon]